MAKLNKNEVIKTIEGYAHGASFIRKERLKQLRSLSTKESLEIFSDLARIWENTKSKSDTEALGSLKIKHLTEQRKKMDRFANWKQSA